MTDVSQLARMQRLRGEALVTLVRAGQQTVLRDLRQTGSAKAMLPRTDDDAPEVVFLNTAGGITSGDVLDYALHLGAGARATATTQTAERAYRAIEGPAGAPGRVTTRLVVGEGARLDWLPQEVIVFEGAHLERATEVELSPDARFLGVETIVLGRIARGEVLSRARLSDLRRIRVGGALLHEEHLDIGPEALADQAALGGMRAFATLTVVAPNVEALLQPLRAALGPEGHASAWDGRLVARLMATDAAPLRRALIRAIVALRRRPMPRVWQSD